MFAFLFIYQYVCLSICLIPVVKVNMTYLSLYEGSFAQFIAPKLIIHVHTQAAVFLLNSIVKRALSPLILPTSKQSGWLTNPTRGNTWNDSDIDKHEWPLPRPTKMTLTAVPDCEVCTAPLSYGVKSLHCFITMAVSLWTVPQCDSIT